MKEENPEFFKYFGASVDEITERFLLGEDVSQYGKFDTLDNEDDSEN